MSSLPLLSCITPALRQKLIAFHTFAVCWGPGTFPARISVSLQKHHCIIYTLYVGLCIFRSLSLVFCGLLLAAILPAINTLVLLLERSVIIIFIQALLLSSFVNSAKEFSFNCLSGCELAWDIVFHLLKTKWLHKHIKRLSEALKLHRRLAHNLLWVRHGRLIYFVYANKRTTAVLAYHQTKLGCIQTLETSS